VICGTHATSTVCNWGVQAADSSVLLCVIQTSVLVPTCGHNPIHADSSFRSGMREGLVRYARTKGLLCVQGLLCVKGVGLLCAKVERVSLIHRVCIWCLLFYQMIDMLYAQTPYVA